MDYINKSDINQERIASLVQGAFAARREQQASEETTFGEKLRSDESIFRSVKLPNDKTPDGERIGYRFVRLIGQGASSRVYLAERLSDKSTLVLKIMDVASIKEPQALQRFVQEAELVSEVNSPYVVRFLEHGFTKEYGYIAMEFFTRGDLKQRIEHGVSLGDALNYIRHIAYGLSAIHQQGIIHRDLKPGNIMFRSDDSLALADFGISRRLNETSELTRLGSVLGTPNYISPEQALGKTVDHRSDLYSAGVVFFEMLTGRKPFKAETAPALVYQHVHADIPQLPSKLQRYQPLIEMLLAKNAAERFSSADEFVEYLERVDRAANTLQ